MVSILCVRSSALASKATGYPLAFVAAKIALGYTLDQIGEMGTPNSAYVAPSLDYMICKIPRWDLTKFAGVSRKIGSSMKSVGEIMSIGRSFEEMLQKGLRMIGQGMHGFVGNDHTKFENLDEELSNPTDLRIFAIAQALEEGYTIERIEELTKIDPWFIERMKNIVDYKHKLSTYNTLEEIPAEVLREAKVLGFSDFQIGRFVLKTKDTNMEKEVLAVRAQRKKLNILPAVKRIPTVASEHPDLTNYLYMTYAVEGYDINYYKNEKSVIVLGSGAYRIRSRTSRLSSISSSDERWLYSSSVNPISLLPVTIPTLHTLAFTPSLMSAIVSPTFTTLSTEGIARSIIFL